MASICQAAQLLLFRKEVTGIPMRTHFEDAAEVWLDK
jgi:hypothetical protein